ncbi:hypothetical protein CP980_23305 [Streptomyces vinaceus]|uniref:DUF2550 family protein n=1 Tax=Streptomyces vinaceus TaxID=1960 RepID=A0A5J6JG72_STRVI|nr:hypothetical protein [Streptomyces vinaceus]QEV47604.1 hypothetical protein CP980_23305 [Streptomyces vinaceus]GHE53311.1 hypothetical protein GCM10017778_41920 [Streptomyces vinaceus]
MIEFLVGAAAACGVGWLIRRKQRQRLAAGSPDGIPCMARHPAGAGRWRMGRVFTGPGGARWVPRRGEPVALTGGRATGVRAPSVKEGMAINPGSRIVACAYGSGEPGGTIEIAVMPLDLAELLAAVPQAGPDTDAPAP